MAWEKRGDNRYYYQKEWINGKCVSTYIGTGEVANLIGQLERGRRIEKHIETARETQNREKLAEIDRDLDEFEQKTKELVDSFLISRGFYKTKSREWRLKK